MKCRWCSLPSARERARAAREWAARAPTHAQAAQAEQPRRHTMKLAPRILVLVVAATAATTLTSCSDKKRSGHTAAATTTTAVSPSPTPAAPISTGTVAGVAAFSDDPWAWYLKPGDVVEAEIEKLGVLRNPIISWKEGHGQDPPPARE